MAFSLVSNVTTTGGANGGTTAGIDTTGANLITVVVPSYSGTAAPTLSDSKSNTYTGLTEQVVIDNRLRMFYVLSPTVGGSHTFTVAGTDSFSSCIVAAWSGAAAFDQQNGATAAGVSSLATGSVTPSENNELLVYGAMINDVGDITAVDIGTLLDHFAGVDSVNFGCGFGYQIQTTATARNPSFTGSGTFNMNAVIATFTAAAAGGATAGFGPLIGGQRNRHILNARA